MLNVRINEQKHSFLIVYYYAERIVCVLMKPLCLTFCPFQLIELLQNSPARGLELSVWIRALFTAHTAYLMTVSTQLDIICENIMLYM